jgi:hypothetical protein
LALWLKADAGTILDGSDNVFIWADQSGNGRDVTQATEASRPAWIAGSASGNINGLPVVHFNTGTKVLERPTSNMLANKDGWTAFAYYRFSTSTANFAPVFFASINGTAASGRASIGAENPSGETRTGWRRLDGDSFQAVIYGTTSADASLNLLAGRMNFDVASLSSMVRRNGVSTTGTAPTSGLISNTSSDVLSVGRSGTLQWYGHIGEVIVYDRALSDVELGQIETYLVGRWGAYS